MLLYKNELKSFKLNQLFHINDIKKGIKKKNKINKINAVSTHLKITSIDFYI